LSHQAKLKIVLEGPEECVRLFGRRDETLRLLKDSFGVRLVARGNEIHLSGDAASVELAAHTLESLRNQLREGQAGLLETHQVNHAIARHKKGGSAVHPGAEKPVSGSGEADAILVSSRKKPITARTRHQREYIEAIRSSDVVLGVGPAGTGKTYLAVAMAVAALRNGEISRILLTRPAVEAGEKLGYLPGDLQDKVDPYLRPLYDALGDMMEFEKLQRLFQQRSVEVAPLAYMRGRTLANAFVILDEAQNTTPEQMKMFLTRMGMGSRMVVTGDITQVDLPPGRVSGLVHVLKVLSGVPGIGVVRFDSTDVVRHPLVQAIVEAYERERTT
jgi:phosphate starvation-inducible protein PhoH and related proteins